MHPRAPTITLIPLQEAVVKKQSSFHQSVNNIPPHLPDQHLQPNTIPATSAMEAEVKRAKTQVEETYKATRVVAQVAQMVKGHGSSKVPKPMSASKKSAKSHKTKIKVKKTSGNKKNKKAGSKSMKRKRTTNNKKSKSSKNSNSSKNSKPSKKSKQARSKKPPMKYKK